MGNAGSSGRYRQNKGPPPYSRTVVAPRDPNELFIFDKNRRGSSTLDYQSSLDEEGPCYTKEMDPTVTNDRSSYARQRSNTVSEGSKVTEKLFPTVFKWNGGGKDVLITGTFTNWKTLPMVKSHQDFVTIIDLPEGEHQFKFCVDGEWKHDPSHKVVNNDMGTKNNLVSVNYTDFEVFQALTMDSESTSKRRMGSEGSKENDYGQEIPVRKPWEKPAGPPILPPHLLQVILNQDIPISREPTVLPEPNHVMLNHLYALTIKDGVLVLSATHRYRKKYVTTLLYKPI
ncbi:protein kinase, beta [Nesidiocoris tenuis]|uniref:5'-AMP-activated protein kinase subunit beta-1 n=1 Tax=Nesidiocoris tenuis TaxID=355587 RepID=A0ABN7ATL1_9HEMI|nr:protein kinase, beta [Nesidiocoris tenuis]